ncbi:MAG: stage III sporulation protein AG [Lawsonibacter sp.]
MKGTWVQRMAGWKEGLGKYKYAALVVVVGVFLLLLPPFGTGEKRSAERADTANGEEFDVNAFEEKLEQVLSRIDGAGEVKVLLTLEGGSRQVLAQDQTRSVEGDVSCATVTVGRGTGSQDVVTLQTVAPEFRGAAVVCPGGRDPQVCYELTRAVSALTGLGADCISVSPGN